MFRFYTEKNDEPKNTEAPRVHAPILWNYSIWIKINSISIQFIYTYFGTLLPAKLLEHFFDMEWKLKWLASETNMRSLFATKMARQNSIFPMMIQIPYEFGAFFSRIVMYMSLISFHCNLFATKLLFVSIVN